MKNCWIIGASSGIGHETAKKYFQQGWNVIISARRIDKLNSLKQQIQNQFPKQNSKENPQVNPQENSQVNTQQNPQQNLQNHIEIFAFDVCDHENFLNSTNQIFEKFGKIDLVIFACAIYKPMTLKNFDLKLSQEILNINLNSALNFIDIVIKKMITLQAGHIAVIASVAGYRGLPKSLAYGASKAGLINLFEGIYSELKANNIDLSIINPGFVATDLTAKNNFKMPFLISTQKASEYIFLGLEQKKFEIHFPKRFTMLMKIIKILPNIFYLKFINYIYNNEK
jgi:short-subunit dehydrogenase